MVRDAKGLSELWRHLTICSKPCGMKNTHYIWNAYDALLQQVYLHLGLHISLLGTAWHTINNSLKLKLWKLVESVSLPTPIPAVAGMFRM
jgi:hypothetical protein